MGFMILSHQRCGATMLQEALNDHPELICLPEPKGKIDGYFLNWWHHFPDKLGMVVKYNQPFGVSPDHIMERGRIIHLVRNPLDCAVSDVINRNKDKYGIPAHIRWELRHRPISLDVTEVSERVKHIVRMADWWRNALGQSDRVLEVHYGDLTGNTEVTRLEQPATDRLCAFLRVPSIPLVVRLRRTNPHIERSVTNWDEIVKAV